MAEAPKKISAKTTLKWGTIEVPVGLLKTTADPAKELKFGSAGPHGGELKMRAAIEPEKGAPAKPDPLALDPGPDHDDPGVAEPQAAREPVRGSVAVEMVVVEEGSGQVVKPNEVRRGVWVAAGYEEDAGGAKFVDCTDALEHIDKITELEVMEIQGAIDIGRVPRERVIGSYYVGVDGADTMKVLALLYQAMKDNRRALVVKWTKTKRQATGVLVPFTRGDSYSLLLLQLAWAEDWRELPLRAKIVMEPEDAPTPAEYEHASELVRAMADSSKLLAEQRDDALELREQVMALALEDRIERFKVPEQPVETPLLDSLKESLELAQA